LVITNQRFRTSKSISSDWYWLPNAAERPAHQPPRARHTNRQNANDLVRAAVGCMGVFGAPVASYRVASRMGRPHLHSITPSTPGVNLNHAHRESRVAHRASI